MRLLVAIGGNALLERGEPATAQRQREHVAVAVSHVVPLLAEHDVVLTHGNGPQVGLLANESARDSDLPAPYPLDILGAESQGMIGYLLLQAFNNAAPDRMVASVLTQTVVDVRDPAFARPTKFIGPIYTYAEAQRLTASFGWTMAPDGSMWRRVVPSPVPRSFPQLPVIQVLLTAGVLVVCSGGGGIPVTRDGEGHLVGIEGVIDKDLAAALLAELLHADALILLTDVAAVMSDFGTPQERPVPYATPEQLRHLHFPEGSMGPKVEAACTFSERTRRPAMIGRLEDASDLLFGLTGTWIGPDDPRLEKSRRD